MSQWCYSINNINNCFSIDPLKGLWFQTVLMRIADDIANQTNYFVLNYWLARTRFSFNQWKCCGFSLRMSKRNVSKVLDCYR